MKTSNASATIPNTACDGGGCTLTTAAAWTNATNSGFGHTCINPDGNHDCASTYSSGTKFRPMANAANGDAVQTIMSSSTPASVIGRVKFRLSVPPSQAAGVYSNLVTYIMTPTY